MSTMSELTSSFGGFHGDAGKILVAASRLAFETLFPHRFDASRFLVARSFRFLQLAVASAVREERQDVRLCILPLEQHAPPTSWNKALATVLAPSPS